ncbi:cytochrome o ubiquinol oxidase [Terrabacter tumescens]|jgi:membrane-associated protein|uniref:Cytochrome o ubiquinol oxidase n=1 Tax=Terrabacter tumescens TaxID=60443 RepID=A0ABQ2I4X4_9MICO|nr:VTT domain-containing protein [Terrabacter tumescens]GGN00253.1 cytochrome o ubiquinol oxidase [Terrabacter tumescens]
MHLLAALPAVAPALGPKWMDPTYLLEQYQGAFFVIALVIVFVECGLLFPILPGDSLLFAVGLFIATGQIDLNLGLAMAALTLAAFLGNVVGYEIGRAVGKPLYKRQGRFINTANFDKTNAFFDKYGNRALVLGRFVPIVRTFITVVAGIGRMHRQRFFGWSAVGAVAWVVGVTLLGYFLGQAFPGLTKNIEYAILLVVLVSLLPMVYEFVKHRREAKAIAAETADAVGDIAENATGTDRRS